MISDSVVSQLVVHPEPMADPARGMLWVLPDVRHPEGRLLRASGELGRLLDTGVLHDACCEPHALRLALRHPLSWREHGAHVREAIREAVADVADWQTDGDRAGVLRMIVEDVLAGPVGRYVASHGGSIEVADVTEDTVSVVFRGACGHCPASDQTLSDRVEAAIRKRYPDLRHVVEHGSCETGRPKLLLWPRGRPGSARSSRETAS